EDGRLDKVAIFEIAFFCTAAAAHQFRFVFAAADVDVLQDLFHRFLIDYRPDVCLFVESRPHTQPFRAIDKHAGEFPGDLTVHHDARCGGATLTCSSERAPQNTFQRELQI